MAEEGDSPFSIDLAEAALRHLAFLDQISAIRSELSGPALEHALRRYVQLWLPLVDENRSNDLAAPIDIEWLWYIHMLSPLAYRRDCRKLLSGNLNHTFSSEEEHVACTNTAIEIWYEKYKLEGFNIIRNGEYTRPTRASELNIKPTNLSINLIQNAEDHMHFCYQVSLPHFRDKIYLENSVKRYHLFLELKRQEPGEFLTPSVDIMLIWFTHMCHPKAYARDLLKMCGQVLDNNVKVRPALVTEEFLAARRKTDALFQKIEPKGIIQPGSKLRPNVHTRKMFSMTLEDLKKCCEVIYKVHLTHAELLSKPNNLRKFHLRLFLSNPSEDIVLLDGPRRMWSMSESFIYNSAEHRNIIAKLFRNSRLWCFNNSQPTAFGDVNIRNLLSKSGDVGKTITAEIYLQDADVKLALDGSIHAAEPHMCSLILELGEFERKELEFNQLKDIIGSMCIPPGSGSRQTCFIGETRLLNTDGVENFRCRVLHIPEMLSSSVQVFFGDKLIATSDVIGSSHLPASTQVGLSELSMAFDPELGERAMLIRNHKGDWGICVARWTQDQQAGYLDVRFMKLVGASRKQARLELNHAEVEFQSFTTNLYTGEVFINPASNAIGENIALIWSIGILYVLCVPKKLHRELSFTTPIRKKISSNVDLTEENDDSPNKSVLVQEAGCQLLLAAGLLTLVPSNAYIQNKYGSLAYDLKIDAQDMIVEEQVTDKHLFRKESKEIKGDFTDTPKKKKKRRLKFKETPGSVTYRSTDDGDTSARSKEENNARPKVNQVAPTVDKIVDDNETIIKSRKRKKLKKRKSSALDEMLSMSDDSITKDDIEEKALTKNKQGKTIAIPKISSLNEDVILSDDSIDKEEKELKEFLQDDIMKPTTELNDVSEEQLKSDGHTNNQTEKQVKYKSDTQNTTTIAEDENKDNYANGSETVSKNNLLVENIGLVREETTMIRDLVEKRKREITSLSMPDKRDDATGATDKGKDTHDDSGTGNDNDNQNIKFYIDSGADEVPTTVDM